MIDRHEKLLAAYFADQINDNERSEIISLLDTDSEFSSRFREMESAYVSACIPAFEKAKARNFRIIEKQIKGTRRTSAFWRPFAIAVSVVAVAFLGAALYNGYKFHRSESFMAQSDIMTIIAKNGTGTETTLPDGTRVCLNAESTLSFNRYFGRDGRDVTIEGEGYFEVASDASRPFRVHAGDACVTVKGTVFNVRSYPDESEMVVSLLEGSVLLNTDAGEALLTPGNCAMVSREDNSIRTAPADPYASDWTKGKITFTDKTIPEILRSVERNYGVHFVYGEALFNGERFTGSISSNLSIDEILSYIDVDGKYRWKRNDDTIEIY